jgi:hypothetical protein
MISSHKLERNGQLRLKKTTDWFAAGEGFLKAMGLLSDGAFKLFVFVSLKADRHTATYRASSVQLAHALRKPRVMIESCLAELKAKGICSIVPLNGLDLECVFRIEDAFWPYYGPSHVSTHQCTTEYVAVIREQFLALGCTSGRFGTSEEAQAKNLETRGIPLEVVRDAMIMGACRKYVSWLNNGYSEPISSIAYFESVITELLRCPPPANYREYLPFELKRLTNHWSRSVQTQLKQIPDPGGVQRHDQQFHGEIQDDAEAVP